MKINPPKFIRRLYPDMIWEIDDSNGVFLTFDDGPTPGITEWILDTLRRYDAKATFFVLGKKKEKLHLLKGLKRILLDIDRAIRIIRETEEEAEVIPNLMIGFGIDQVQAEYVAEIKLRNINKEYILKRVAETSALQDEIEDLEDLSLIHI